MSIAEESWSEFLTTLSENDGEGVLTQLKCKLDELMDKQAHIDQARKALFKPEFNQVLKLYIKKFEPQELSKMITKNEKTFVRAFGRDRFNHLKLLVRLKTIEDSKPKRRGLLAV